MRSDSTAHKLTFTERARRRQIVEAAIVGLAEDGYARTSLQTIARRIGVSKGVISYHFAGKDELIEQVVAMVTEAASGTMTPRIRAASPGRARLGAYIESNLEFMAAHRAGIVALLEIFNALPREREGQPVHYAGHHRAVVASLAELLREGQHTGELRIFDTWMAAITIRAAIDGAGYRLGADPDFDAAAYGRELADFFDHAVREPRPSQETQ